jgi:glycosyltransferase involved in cell wall biosynthesis
VTPSRRGSPGVTAVIAAHDESANIEACIASVDWANEVIVVENDSIDDTVDRARGAGATVINPKFTTIGAARNHAIERVKTPWVLVLDADERCTPQLATEISQVLDKPRRQSAFKVPRRNFFLGREIRHGGWGNDRPIRLFRKELRYNASMVHEHVNVIGETGVLRGALVHNPYTSLDQYFEKFDRYSRWWAEQSYAQGRRGSAVAVLFSPPVKFVSMYMVKRGFLDGGHGLLLACLAAASVIAKQARLWELKLRAPR